MIYVMFEGGVYDAAVMAVSTNLQRLKDLALHRLAWTHEIRVEATADGELTDFSQQPSVYAGPAGRFV